MRQLDTVVASPSFRRPDVPKVFSAKTSKREALRPVRMGGAQAARAISTRAEAAVARGTFLMRFATAMRHIPAATLDRRGRWQGGLLTQARSWPAHAISLRSRVSWRHLVQAATEKAAAAMRGRGRRIEEAPRRTRASAWPRGAARNATALPPAVRNFTPSAGAAQRCAGLTSGRSVAHCCVAIEGPVSEHGEMQRRLTGGPGLQGVHVADAYADGTVRPLARVQFNQVRFRRVRRPCLAAGPRRKRLASSDLATV